MKLKGPLKVKESFKSQGKRASEIEEIFKKNRVTLDVTSAWKSREALKLKGSVESQEKR